MKSRKKLNTGTPMKWIEAVFFRGTDTPVVINRVDPQDDIERHIHDFTEMTLILQGTGIHDFGKESYRLKAGDCFLVEPGMSHGYRSTDKLHLVNVLMQSFFMEKFGQTFKSDPAYPLLLGRRRRGRNGTSARPSLPQEELDACMIIINEIERESLEMRRSHATMLTGLLLELLARVLRSAESTKSMKDDMRSPWLSKVLTHLEIHFAEDVPMGQLLKLAGMSERSFQRHFHAMTGLTPLRYLLHLRMAKACRLLKEENRNTHEVASLCGIPDCSYFCRLFKKTTGHSPRKYAKLSGQAV